MNAWLDRQFDLGEGLRAVWLHEDDTRCTGLYPGVLSEGPWFECVISGQRVHLDRIRPMIREEET